MIKKLIEKIILKKASKAVNNFLQEGPVMEGKKWYKSKGMWTGVVTVLISTYEGIQLFVAPQLGWELPNIPPVVYTILGAFGIYARKTATGPIK